MTEETMGGEDKQLGPEEELNGEDLQRLPRVIVQPHQLGGIEVAVRDLAEGKYVGTRIDIPEAALVMAHLQALVTIGFNSIYQQAAQPESDIVIPGRGR